MFTFYELNLNEENQTQEQDTFNTFYFIHLQGFIGPTLFRQHLDFGINVEMLIMYL